MTTETRTTIELQDIIAIELECKLCGTKSTRKLDKNLVVPVICDNCRDQWMIGNSDELHALTSFFQELCRYTGNKFKYKLRLQITPSVSQTSTDRQ